MPAASPAGPSDFLAAERTFLAWLRTGLALMGFGFVVARFGLFVQELGLVATRPQARPTGLSLGFGTGLIVLGVLINAASGWSYARNVRRLKRGEAEFHPSASLGVTLAVILAVLGLAMAIGLVYVGRHAPGRAGAPEVSDMEAESGIVSVPSHQSVDETVAKLQSLLQAGGVKLFALVDHSGEAQAVGFRMRPTKLLLFGNPKAGTPLMLAAPSIAIDLPLKLLVWEDAAGKVWISYNTPQYLQARHRLPPELAAVLNAPAALAGKAGG